MNSSSELLQLSSTTEASRPPMFNSSELAQLKRLLLQAEVRLAKARAGVTGAEVDVKVLNSRLRALTK